MTDDISELEAAACAPRPAPTDGRSARLQEMGVDLIPGIVAELRAPQAALQPLLEDVAADLHAHPELRFTEYRAAARLTAELEAHGFAVERGFAGLETAFVGRWSTPGAPADAPTVAVFCEYDALEGLGHACGHNLIAACGLGAGLLAKAALEEEGAPSGNLVVIGSPGEEGAAGKVPMIEGGVLDGIDLAVMTHPGGADQCDVTTLSRVALDIDFTGRASHAAASPELGLNALDAATLSLTAIGLLRQQLPDDVRIHAIITDGGQAPNIIPEHTALRVFVRAASRSELEERVLPRVEACFQGAAIATGCQVTIAQNTPPYYSMISNPALVALADAAFDAVGRRERLGAGPAASTDMGNVSQVIPAIHPMIELGPGLVPHTREFTQNTAPGQRASRVIADGSLALAAVVVAAIRQPAVVAAAQADFSRQMGR